MGFLNNFHILHNELTHNPSLKRTSPPVGRRLGSSWLVCGEAAA